VDKYLWLQFIGLGSLFSPSAMVLEASGLSWLVERLFRGDVAAPNEKVR